jgi:hypothetical protein
VAQGAGVVVRVVLLVLVLPTLGAGGPLRDQNKSTIYDKTLIDTNSQQKACQKLRNSRMSSKKFQKCRGCRGFWLFLLKNPVDQALGFEVWAGTRASTGFQAGKCGSGEKGQDVTSGVALASGNLKIKIEIFRGKFSQSHFQDLPWV